MIVPLYQGSEDILFHGLSPLVLYQYRSLQVQVLPCIIDQTLFVAISSFSSWPHFAIVTIIKYDTYQTGSGELTPRYKQPLLTAKYNMIKFLNIVLANTGQDNFNNYMSFLFFEGIVNVLFYNVGRQRYDHRIIKARTYPNIQKYFLLKSFIIQKISILLGEREDYKEPKRSEAASTGGRYKFKNASSSIL